MDNPQAARRIQEFNDIFPQGSNGLRQAYAVGSDIVV